MIINCKKIILIKNKENLGYPKGVNQGLKVALKNNSIYFLVVNNDVEYYPQTINELLKACRNSHFGYITAVDKTRNWKSVKDLPDDWWLGLCNSCFVLKKETIDKVGFYDENFGLGFYEDMDYIHRMGILGIESRGYRPAIVEHEHSFTSKKYNLNTCELLSKNREYCNKKHGIKLQW